MAALADEVGKCARCQHTVAHHRYRDSGDERPGACQFTTEAGNGAEVCNCPGFVTNVTPLPRAALDFDTSDDE